MKQRSFLFVLVIALSALCIGGCSKVFEAKPQNITLTGNPTTGYTWLYEVCDSEIVSVNEDIIYLGKEGIVGAPSLYTYTLTSVKEGKTVIKFRYQRPWESGDPEKTVQYSIRVNRKGKIRIRKI